MAQTAAAAAPTAAPATTDSAATTVPAAPTTADPCSPPQDCTELMATYLKCMESLGKSA